MNLLQHSRLGRWLGLWAAIAWIVPGLLSGQAAPAAYVAQENGTILINFDDTYKSAFTLAYPILKAKGFQGTVFISPYVVGRWASKMTEADLRELNAAGWDVSSHGWSHVSPKTLGDAELTAHLRDAHQWLVARGFTRGARHYTPPNGGCDARVLAEAVKYYKSIRMFYYLKDLCWLMPKGYTYKVVRAHDAAITWEALKAEIDAVNSSNEVLLLNFHNIVTTTPSNNQTSTARLKRVVNYLADQKKTVFTFSQLLDGGSVSLPPNTVPSEDGAFALNGGRGRAGSPSR